MAFARIGKLIKEFVDPETGQKKRIYEYRKQTYTIIGGSNEYRQHQENQDRIDAEYRKAKEST